MSWLYSVVNQPPELHPLTATAELICKSTFLAKEIVYKSLMMLTAYKECRNLGVCRFLASRYSNNSAEDWHASEVYTKYGTLKTSIIGHSRYIAMTRAQFGHVATCFSTEHVETM
jgi:hypothetical protein